MKIKMFQNNENFVKIKNIFIKVDLIIICFGFLAFLLIFILPLLYIYFAFNFYYIFAKCIIAFIYSIKCIHAYWLKENNDKAIIYTILPLVVAIPASFRIGNQLNEYFNIGFGFYVIFAFYGVAYWIRLLFNNWRDLNEMKLLYIICLILNIIITYYEWHKIITL